MLGLIGIKEGMTQIFNDEGNVVPATIVRIEKNFVINKKSSDKDGYNAIVLGCVDIKDKQTTKPYRGQFKDNIKPKRHLKEFKVKEVDKFEVGQEVGMEVFEGVEYLDVTSISKGKGFQGVMKRHNFHGGPKTHGSKFHRQNGSTGMATYPGRGWKGVKRAGRMGGETVTAQNLKVVSFDNERNVIFIRGSVPGISKGVVYLKKSVKKVNKDKVKK